MVVGFGLKKEMKIKEHGSVFPYRDNHSTLILVENPSGIILHKKKQRENNMPQTRTSCPRCHQPIMADINQLFDTNIDPQAKQKILSGQFNVANCPNCGFQGTLSTPLVYHDPEKELLLTFFPPELGLPVNEQEKLIGPLINQAVNKLPLEKRKAYILRPQTMFTMQVMIEKILESDGITKEMIQNQEKKIALIRELMTSPRIE